MKQSITIYINGQKVQRDVPDDLALIDFLQEDLGLTGTKLCCGIGVCRACTVAVRRTPQSLPQPLLACSTPAVLLDGESITTIEGIGQPAQLDRIQQVFLDHFAFQCGYCTPGQICSAVGLANEGRASSRAEIQEMMSGNLCRCGAYSNILAAVEEVLPEMRQAQSPRTCLLYTSPSPRDATLSRMPSSA